MFEGRPKEARVDPQNKVRLNSDIAAVIRSHAEPLFSIGDPYKQGSYRFYLSSDFLEFFIV